MTSFTFLHCADLHLGSSLKRLKLRASSAVNQNVETVKYATRQAFSNLIDKAIANRVDFIVMAGDIFDGQLKDMSTGLFFANKLATLKEHGIHTFIVWGNHDAECQFATHISLEDEYVHVFASEGPQSLRIDGLPDVVLHGQSYEIKEVSENLASAYPKPVDGAFNIGVLHTNVGDSTGHANYAPSSVSQLKNFGYQYWALGHVHSYKQLSDNELAYIVYPGNLQGRHIRETGSKGAVLVEVQDNRVQSCVPIACNCVEWHDIHFEIGDDIQSMDDLMDGLKQRVIETVGPDTCHVVRVTLCGRTSLHGELHSQKNLADEDLEEVLELKIQTSKSTVFVESVVLATEDPSNLSAAINESELADFFKVLESDDAKTEIEESLRKTFQKLKGNIPSELKSPEHPELRPSQDPELKFLLDAELSSLTSGSIELLKNMLAEEAN